MITSLLKKQLKRNSLLLSILLFFSISSSANTALSPKIQIDTYKNSIAHFYGLKSGKNLTLLNMKGYQQTTDYTCAPAAVMSLMHYYGMLSDNDLNKTTEMRIAKEM